MAMNAFQEGRWWGVVIVTVIISGGGNSDSDSNGDGSRETERSDRGHERLPRR